jgi:hypothetical protein
MKPNPIGYKGGCDIARAIQFIRSCIRLRSIRLALWVDSYDNYANKNRP